MAPEDPQGAHTWRIRFKPRETKKVEVTFSFGGLNTFGGPQELSYLLKTGSLWADKIGEADIYWNFNGRRVDVSRISPAGYKIKNDVIHWHFEDFEPNADITIFAAHGE